MVIFETKRHDPVDHMWKNEEQVIRQLRSLMKMMDT
jgi:hypothetical protein